MRGLAEPRSVWQRTRLILDARPFLWLLVFVNGLGTIYGYIWYKAQLFSTPVQWLPFVPDSPTASAFFTLFLILYLVRRSNPWVEAFGAVTSVKYGLWAVIMIVWGTVLKVEATGSDWGWDSFLFTDYMLMTSHLGMAVEAILYYRLYRFGAIHITGIALWVYANDLADYGWGMHPDVSRYLAPFITQMAIITISLSTISLFLFLYLRKKVKNAV
jgi:uncharacterized membrane protein YpjA